MKKIPTTPVFETALHTYHTVLNAALKAYYRHMFPSLEPTQLFVDEGLRYVRIWSASPSERSANNRGSAYAFIDKHTGNVLKPDGWKKPAKGARGNILDASWLDWAGPYGPGYLNSGSLPFCVKTPDDVSILRDAVLAFEADKAGKLYAEMITPTT